MSVEVARAALIFLTDIKPITENTHRTNIYGIVQVRSVIEDC